MCSCNKSIKTLQLSNSCIVYERKTKNVHGRGPSDLNLGPFVCSFDGCRSYGIPKPAKKKTVMQMQNEAHSRNKYFCGIFWLVLEFCIT